MTPKAPGGAGSRACAATRLGAAGVAGGNRTDLGDQSVGGIGASESTNTGTHSRTIVLAGNSEAAGPMDLRRLRKTPVHLSFRPPAPFLGQAGRNENKEATGLVDAEQRRVATVDGGRLDPLDLRKGS